MGLEVLLREVPKGEYPAQDMPKYPGLILTYHVLLRGVQLSSVLSAVGATGWALYNKKKGVKRSFFFDLWPKTSFRLFPVGVGIGAFLLWSKAQTMDPSGVDDRGYRLAHNRNQNLVDIYSGVGFAAGAPLFAVAGVGRGFSKVVGGGLVGMTLGLVAYTAQQASKKYLPNSE
eukprot:TRINITY_DN5279_c0_g1_i1.p1 TRINITY_DN5279_c0_g1~~TRINITY_DN5279_c0_g1_i1.p1  ORF type:complete len:173 (-),score=33.72 TRINITY_DN5279_c0_g1_i1:21-539(-)